MSSFANAPPALADALARQGYDTPTPVQEAVLEASADGADLLVSARTGSGKTVAFGLAIAPTLLDGAESFAVRGAPLGLVVAPTRELALQVCRELDWLYAPTGAHTATCVGGMDMRRERDALSSGAHIVVGTPGRLRDHIERGSLDLSAIRAVVLDEADEMLDLGFREDLEYILDAAPAARRTLLFSATVSRPIARLAKRFQRDAVRISTATEHEAHGDIEYHAHSVGPVERENAIINLLLYHEADSALVFCGTRAAVTHLTARFANRGFSVVALSGELSQNERTHALQAMRDGRARVCVATDVAARGLDLPRLDLVIHADVPTNRETLLHRSGRTGRAGRKGISALVVPHPKRSRIVRLLREANVEAAWSPPPTAARIAERDRARFLTHPALTEPLTDEEREFAQALLADHDAEQVAAAYLRMSRANRPAPEEMLDGGPAAEESRGGRDAFESSAWYRLNVGHKHQADPRWLLPLICRAGHLTKRDVGAIRVLEAETRFEVAAGAVERFEAAVGRSGRIEDGITLTRIPGEPDGGRSAPGRRPGPGGRGGPGGRVDGRGPPRRRGPDGPGARGGKPGGPKGKRRD